MSNKYVNIMNRGATILNIKSEKKWKKEKMLNSIKNDK